jgi:hypothetical protein
MLVNLTVQSAEQNIVSIVYREADIEGLLTRNKSVETKHLEL